MTNNSSRSMQKMVVHKADGTVIKGISYNFSPFINSIFHLNPTELVGDEPKSLEIKISELKAIFIVKSFSGNPDYKDKKDFQSEGIHLQLGRKAEIIFSDGEKVCGILFTYDPKKTGFWLFPIDPNDNNEKIFIVSSMVKDIKFV